MEDRIRQRAYELWEADGRPDGQDQAYWFKAMAEIAAAAITPIKPARKRTTKPKVAKAA
jgi:hypothetical protein